jgi:membrane protein implicated in regulation of membrane protease activity
MNRPNPSEERLQPTPEEAAAPTTAENVPTAASDGEPASTTPVTPAPAAPPATEATDEAPASKADGKRKAKKILLSLVIALGVLLLLNLIPFDRLADAAIEEIPEETQPAVTYPAENFYTPDYDEDVMQDEIYLKYNRLLTFARDGEAFSVTADTAHGYGPVCMLFQDYMETLMAGDTEACNKLFTDDYLEKKGKFNFAPQKVYDMRVEVVRSEVLTEGDAKGEYKGYTVSYCEVSYKLRQNNGTLRRDFYREGDTLPQIFEVLEKDGVAQINQIRSIRSGSDTTPTQTKGGQIIMYVVWIVAIVLAVIAEAQTAALTAIWFVPGAVVSLILALCNVSWQIQVLVFALLSLVMLLFGLLFVRKRIKKMPHIPTNSDRIIGMEGKVTEVIDGDAPTGEVKVDGKRWTARSADGSVIPEGEIVTILRIEGVKVIVERR